AGAVEDSAGVGVDDVEEADGQAAEQHREPHVAARLVGFLGERGGLLKTDERQDAEDRGGDNPGEPPVLRVVGELGAEHRQGVVWRPAWAMSGMASAGTTRIWRAPRNPPAGVEAGIPR